MKKIKTSDLLKVSNGRRNVKIVVLLLSVVFGAVMYQKQPLATLLMAIGTLEILLAEVTVYMQIKFEEVMPTEKTLNRCFIHYATGAVFFMLGVIMGMGSYFR